MGLFGRNDKMPQFVPHGASWQPFDAFLAECWDTIAASAWIGYSTQGRGAVTFDFDNDMNKYVAVHGLTGTDKFSRGVRALCAKYNPERVFVVFLKGARDSKSAREGRNDWYWGIISTPICRNTPLDAYKEYQADRAFETALTVLARKREPMGRDS